MRDAGVISRNLWPDQERLGSIHAWSTVFTFSVRLRDLSVSKDDVNSALGYSTAVNPMAGVARSTCEMTSPGLLHRCSATSSNGRYPLAKRAGLSGRCPG